MFQIALSETEITLLQEYAQKSSLITQRLKAQAILLKSQKIGYESITLLISRDRRTIQRWVKDFIGIRVGSIFTGHSKNQNASKLTKTQKLDIQKILQKPPSEYNLPKDFWSLPALKDYLAAEFGVVYESDRSYHFLLKFSRLSFKEPAKFDTHRDDERVEKRLKEIKEEIAPFLSDPKWEVFVSDETRIVLEALTRKAWLKKGIKTIVKVKRSNEYQSYFGLLNQKNGHCFLSEMPWQNQKEVLKVLKVFIKQYPQKRICIVWDNAKFHTGKLIRKELSKGGILERVHLIHFEPYAPDTNPIEHVWEVVKRKVLTTQYKSFEDTKKVFSKFVKKNIFSYKI